MCGKLLPAGGVNELPTVRCCASGLQSAPCQSYDAAWGGRLLVLTGFPFCLLPQEKFELLWHEDRSRALLAALRCTAEGPALGQVGRQQCRPLALFLALLPPLLPPPLLLLLLLRRNLLHSASRLHAADLAAALRMPAPPILPVYLGCRCCGWPTCTWRGRPTAPTTGYRSSSTRCSGWRGIWVAGKVRGGKAWWAVGWQARVRDGVWGSRSRAGLGGLRPFSSKNLPSTNTVPCFAPSGLQRRRQGMWWC